MTRFTIAPEEWRPVLGWEGLYEVSNRGRVRSLDREVVDSRGRDRRFPGRELTQQSMTHGHRKVMLYDKAGGRYKNAKVHRLVLEAFTGPCPEGMECRHLDGNPAHNYVANLAWGTHAENEADKDRYGDRQRGARHPSASLTQAQVDQIRALYARGGTSQRQLAKSYGVNQKTISRIIRRETYVD